MKRKIILNKYHLLDSRKLKDIIKGKKVSVTITSPPYGSLKNYGGENQIGFGQEYNQFFLSSLIDVFKNCYDITKENGSLWIIVDTYKENSKIRLFPFDLASQLEQIGWHLKDIIIWDKRKNLPWSRRGQFRNSFEYILFFTKSDNYKYYIDRLREPNELKEWWVKYPERYNPKGKVPTNIWDIQIPTQGSWSDDIYKHFCPFPQSLVERIIQLTTNRGDIVLDPFAGSGVVLAQAHCMSRKWVGFDINEKFQYQFYNHILEDICSKWEANSGVRRSKTSSQIELEKNIIKLRSLKYPSQILKFLKKNNPELASNIKLMIVEKALVKKNSDSKKHIFIKLVLTIFIAKHDDFDEQFVISKIDSLATKKPLSKYGIEHELKIIEINRLEEAKKTIDAKGISKYYLYKIDHTHKYLDTVQNNNIVEKLSVQTELFNNSRTIPIISDIKISIK